ncbi:hypothetical protein KIN20_022361 [Parelaphostrongylus tenuis]|uniref:Uncharacterized protein n=1 Tax=Parelaphostrongylus tenuis TaxID=148309 RepID=A0AAD5N5J1_PARTN|nr:hypothetical protein KIN20_022361 [Parelaphostrongylus tenuis]
MSPSFSPSQSISEVSLRKDARNLHELQDKRRKKAGAHEISREEQQKGETSPIPPFPQPFYRQPDLNKEADGKIRIFTDETFRTPILYRSRRFQSDLTEVQKCGMKEVRDLIRQVKITIS